MALSLMQVRVVVQPRAKDQSSFLGTAIPYSRDYKQKYDYFRRQLKRLNVPSGKFEIKIRRKYILEDSFKVLL